MSDTRSSTEVTAAIAYGEQYGIQQLLNAIAIQLLTTRPENPLAYLASLSARMAAEQSKLKNNGYDALIKEHCGSMPVEVAAAEKSPAEKQPVAAKPAAKGLSMLKGLRGGNSKAGETKPEDPLLKVHSAIRWNKPSNDVETAIKEAGLTISDALAKEDPRNGNRCLHIAAQNGHTKLVDYLLTQSAEINAANGKGQTPLHMSIEYDFYFQSKFLLDRGANPDAVNNEGHSAMTGVDGTKTGSDAWDNPITILQAASDDSHQLDVAFTALEGADVGSLDKAKLAMAGMKKKKECKVNWSSDRFTAIMNKI